MLRRVLIALVALLALTLAGCGSSATTRTVVRHARARTVTDTVTAGGSTSASTTTSTSSGASGSNTQSASGECDATDLAVRFLGGAGATGHGELGVALRNVTGAPCRTGGYPGAEFLDAGGGSLPTHPDHTTDDFFGHTTLQELVVAPGQSVSFRLGVSHVGSGGSGAGCVTAHGLQVIAPNDTRTMRLALSGIAECGGTVTVSPLQPGTSAFQH